MNSGHGRGNCLVSSAPFLPSEKRRVLLLILLNLRIRVVVDDGDRGEGGRARRFRGRRWRLRSAHYNDCKEGEIRACSVSLSSSANKCDVGATSSRSMAGRQAGTSFPLLLLHLQYIQRGDAIGMHVS